MNTKPFPILFLATALGCAQTRCLDADCTLEPEANSTLIDAGLVEAKAVMADAGTVVSEATLVRIQSAINARPIDCEVMAIMAVRWGYQANDFDGFILSPTGEIVATTDGYFAPVRPKLGVFAGTIEDGNPYTDPIVTQGPNEPDIDPNDQRLKGDASDSLVGTDPMPAPPDEIEDPSTLNHSLGGAYKADHTFSGAVSGPAAVVPVVGIWKPLDERGGFALGVLVESAADSQTPGDCLQIESIQPETDPA